MPAPERRREGLGTVTGIEADRTAADGVRVPAWVDGRLQAVDKMEVHRRGLRHKAVSVFVLRGAETLIQRRAPGKYHSAGLWANACCTHPHWDEAGADCAARRLVEELGVRGLALAPRPSIAYRARVGPDMIEDEIVEVFVAEAPAGTIVDPDPAEVDAVRWLSLDALRAEVVDRPGTFTAWMRIYVARHLPEILGEIGARRSA